MDNVLLARINELFNNGKLRSFLGRVRYPLAGILFLLFVPLVHSSLLLLGLVVSLFGELIQIWSFATLRKNEVLVNKGPYSLVRNPMYIGRFFLCLGFMILTNSLLIVLIFSATYYFYAVNRVKREEKQMHSLFGRAYEGYCRKVNRFVPSLKGAESGSVGYFDWRLLLRNHGHLNLLAVLSCYACLYFLTSTALHNALKIMIEMV